VLGSRVIVGTNWISNYMCTSTSQESFFADQLVSMSLKVLAEAPSGGGRGGRKLGSPFAVVAPLQWWLLCS